MAKREGSEYEVNGHKLICPVCSKSYFWTRTTLMNTRGLTFFNLDWANVSADNYVCSHCGHVSWFLNE